MRQETVSPTSICVIGCGPGGLSFCHALETKRQKIQANNDPKESSLLPVVECFEKASGPGGVWRSKRSFVPSLGSTALSSNPSANSLNSSASSLFDEQAVSHKVDEVVVSVDTTEENSVQMYEALWTNGPKETLEYFDYTFDEHFGRALPVYVPRAALLDYILARVTKNCPDFFDKYVRFNTAVQSVRWMEDIKKFDVVVQDTITGSVKNLKFDKCVWAGGDNGKVKVPKALQILFEGFEGRMIHSTGTSNFVEDVKDKRVLIIGGSYSAEDLALMACKVGVDKLYISSRRSENCVTYHSAWPGNKVEILKNYIPIQVSKRSIKLAKCEWVEGTHYEPQPENGTAQLHNIDTVIFCTGYERQTDMLDHSLRAPLEKDKNGHFTVPDDWRMKPNTLSSQLGHVPPSKQVKWNGDSYFPHLYDGMLITNPNMMYLVHPHWLILLATDALAWLLVGYVTGSVEIPSEQEMLQRNREQALNEMQYMYHRYYMDSNYRKAWDSVEGIWVGYDDYSSEHFYHAESSKAFEHNFRLLARTMRRGRYPLDMGDFEEFNEVGRAFLEYENLSFYHKYNLDPANKDTIGWKTFRDIDDAEAFKSVFTGTSAVPLHDKWINIDDENDQTYL